MIPKPIRPLLLMVFSAAVFLLFWIFPQLAGAEITGEFQDAIDISHCTTAKGEDPGTINLQTVRCWVEDEGFRHIIVRIGIREEVGGTCVPGQPTRRYSKQQLETLWQALQDGVDFSLDIYLYLHWPGPGTDYETSVRDQVREAIGILDELDIGAPPLAVGRLWIDIEETPPEGQTTAETIGLIEDALDECGSIPCGIYTRKDIWETYTDNTTKFSGYPLWYALYNYTPNFNEWYHPEKPWEGPFGGWDDPDVKQYSDDYLGHLCDASVDYDIMANNCLATVSPVNWQGEYFGNKNLSGPPLMVREDGDKFLGFDWAFGGPGDTCGIDPESFSARWQRDVYFETGTYRFTVTSDDGVRLYIDGGEVLSEWNIQGPTTFVTNVKLSEGFHWVMMEYFENGGYATAQLSWQQLNQPDCIKPGSPRNWQGEYFGNKDLSGAPLMVRTDGSGPLSFDWAFESPSTSCGLDAENFSARWTRSVYFEAGTYRFTITSDDGFRFYVDGVPKLKKWIIQGPTTYTVDVPLSGGDHTIKLEYFENGGYATAQLSWKKLNQADCIKPGSPRNWQGEYFGNKNLSGAPLMVRTDGSGPLSFDWAFESPSTSCGLDAENFSARWTRSVYFEAGTYRFTITSDDGFRFYVDGVRKLKKWIIQGPTTYTVDVPLSGGDHTIKLEYFENGGYATARLSWKQIAQSLPDLRVSGITFSPFPRAGVQTIATAQLANVGQSAAGGFNVKWFLNGQQVGYGYHTPLAAGQVSTDNVRFYWTPAAGSYTLRFEADVDKNVAESNENNNSYFTAVTVTY